MSRADDFLSAALNVYTVIFVLAAACVYVMWLVARRLR
jgi:hypothetical protein